jgi:hypothetical protein
VKGNDSEAAVRGMRITGLWLIGCNGARPNRTLPIIELHDLQHFDTITARIKISE